MADLCVVPVRPHRIERVPQRVVDLTGLDELAQQRVDQSREEQLIGHVLVAVPLVRRSEELAHPEEEGRRVVAAPGDDVVGGVLEPGPQPAGQARVEPRARRCASAQQRQDLSSRATIRRRLTLGG